ncbi:MAG: transposase [Thiobacillaceae bacterium]
MWHDSESRKSKTQARLKRYTLGKQTGEPAFGVIKAVMGLPQDPMRGFAAAQNEWDFLCLGWNIKHMAALRSAEPGSWKLPRSCTKNGSFEPF